jgi:hypothetical protein
MKLRQTPPDLPLYYLKMIQSRANLNFILGAAYDAGLSPAGYRLCEAFRGEA